jgi:short subunit fatty acids transporter
MVADIFISVINETSCAVTALYPMAIMRSDVKSGHQTFHAASNPA